MIPIKGVANICLFDSQVLSARMELDPLAEISNIGAQLPWPFQSKESSRDAFARLIAQVR